MGPPEETATDAELASMLREALSEVNCHRDSLIERGYSVTISQFDDNDDPVDLSADIEKLVTL